MKKQNKVTGNCGEDQAAAYLSGLGYRILARNFRVRFGEIDIAAMDGDTVVFVEVKARHTLFYGRPAQAVNYHKQQKILQVARYFLRQRHLEGCLCRFDVIEVYFSGEGGRLRHIRGAFEA